MSDYDYNGDETTTSQNGGGVDTSYNVCVYAYVQGREEETEDAASLCREIWVGAGAVLG